MSRAHVCVWRTLGHQGGVVWCVRCVVWEGTRVQRGGDKQYVGPCTCAPRVHNVHSAARAQRNVHLVKEVHEARPFALPQLVRVLEPSVPAQHTHKTASQYSRKHRTKDTVHTQQGQYKAHSSSTRISSRQTT
eukprot:2954862-Rhodomonas_salina.2